MGLFKFFPLLLLVVCTNARTLNPTNQEVDYRLNTLVTPIHYDIEIKPYLDSGRADREQFTFDGVAKIHLTSDEPDVKEITLHSQGLTIKSVHLEREDNTSENIPVQVSNPDPTTDKLIVTLDTGLIKDVKYILTFEYSGFINSKPIGFYRSSYEDENGEISWMAATNFYPTYARRAFPCFDEPHFKTTFALKINHSNKYKALTNTNLKQSTPVEGEDRTIDEFTTTPGMKTFNFAFSLTKFPENTARPQFHVQTKHTKYVDQLFELLEKIIHNLEEYLELVESDSFGVKKLDIVAVPDQDSFTPKFHWGLLFINDKIFECFESCPQRIKEKLFLEVSKAMVENWFGNLISPQEWRDVWITEGFANYFKYAGLIDAIPNWDPEYQYFTRELYYLLFWDPFQNYTLDFDKSSMSPDEITELIKLTAMKGPVVLSMFNHLFGQEKFLQAIKDLFVKNEIKPITQNDFYETLAAKWDYTEVDFKDIYSDYTKQTNFPSLTINVAEDFNSFTVTQQAYPAAGKDDSHLKWTVPITFTTSKDRNFTYAKQPHFLKRDTPLHVTLDEPADWIVVNIRHMGYYRVNYNKQNWILLLEALMRDNFGGIHYMNRAQMVRDLLKNGETGTVSYEIVLEVLKFLVKETNPAVWQVFFEYLPEVYAGLKDDHYIMMKRYLHTIFEEKFKHFDYNLFDDEDVVFELNRYRGERNEQIFMMSCMVGVKKCLDKAIPVADNFLDGDHHDLTYKTELALAIAVSHNPEKYFDKVFNVLKTRKPEDVYLAACTMNREKLLEVLKFIIESPNVHNAYEQFRSLIITDCVSQDILGDFVLDHFKEIVKGDSYDANNLINNIGELINTQERYEKLLTITRGNHDDLVLKENKIEAAELFGRETVERYNDFYIPTLIRYFEDSSYDIDSEGLGDIPNDITKSSENKVGL